MQLLFSSQYGSRLYGTSLPSSDIDIKHVYLPALDDLLLNKRQRIVSESSPTKNNPGDVDISWVPLQTLAGDFINGHPYALELVFSSEPGHERNTHHHHAFHIFCLQLRELYLTSSLRVSCNPLKVITTLRLKDAMHTIRIAQQANKLLSDGSISFPLSKLDIQLLLSIKSGELAGDQLQSYADYQLALFNEKLAMSQLQTLTPELHEKFNEWLVGWLKRFYNLV